MEATQLFDFGITLIFAGAAVAVVTMLTLFFTAILGRKKFRESSLDFVYKAYLAIAFTCIVCVALGFVLCMLFE